LFPNSDNRDAVTNTDLLPGLVSLQELDKLERKNRKRRFDFFEPFEEETDDYNDKKKTNKVKLTTDDEEFMSEEICVNFFSHGKRFIVISFIIAITTHSMTCPTPEKKGFYFHHEERKGLNSKLNFVWKSCQELLIFETSNNLKKKTLYTAKLCLPKAYEQYGKRYQKFLVKKKDLIVMSRN